MALLTGAVGPRLDLLVPTPQEGESPLHCAAARGLLAAVRSLVTAGASLRAADAAGATALHLALRRRHVAVAHLLLDAGAPRDATDQVSGNSAAVSQLRPMCRRVSSRSSAELSRGCASP